MTPNHLPADAAALEIVSWVYAHAAIDLVTEFLACNEGRPAVFLVNAPSQAFVHDRPAGCAAVSAPSTRRARLCPEARQHVLALAGALVAARSREAPDTVTTMLLRQPWPGRAGDCLVLACCLGGETGASVALLVGQTGPRVQAALD